MERNDSKEFLSIFVQSNLIRFKVQESSSTIRLLSPFDNSIIHRERISYLFDFDYRLECYLPKGKRKYGYFCLPVLFGDKFIGRVDCKTHRKEKLFEIIHFHIEKEGMNIESWEASIITAVKNFAVFNGCNSIVIRLVTPAKLTTRLNRLLKNSY